MKSLKNILVGVFALAALSSCTKALDRVPITEYTNETFWNEPEQASAALNGLYSVLQPTLNIEFSYYGEARADILEIARTNSTQTIALVYNRLDPNLGITDWSGFYRVVNQANLIIKKLPEMKERGIYFGKDSEYNRVMGQALAMRAYCYFYMSRIWGDVPLLTEPTVNTGDITDFKTPRTPVAQVYNQISTDLLAARELLPTSYTNPQQTRAMITRGGADAILTDYYMWRQNYDSALIASGRLMTNTTYGLVNLYNPAVNYLAIPQSNIDATEYAQMFQAGFSRESVFELAFSYDENAISSLLTLFAGGAGNAQFFADPGFAASYSGDDLRRLNNFKSDVQIFKHFPKTTFDRTTENDKNIILYRLADIMLLRAEALNKHDRRAEAWELLKQVRARVFGPASATSATNNDVSGPTGTDQQTLFMNATMDEAEDIILEERKKELAFEGKRWYDLVRTGKAIPTMMPRNGMSNPENLLFPINLNIIRQNPLIEQNNFYK